MSRFDYVKYDTLSAEQQECFKTAVIAIEMMIESLKSPAPKQKAINKLEECYMWIGKAIRDDQIARNGSAELQEERKNG